MSRKFYLNVNGIMKETCEINIDDLRWLYKDYEKRNGKLPTTNDGKLCNNLPQQRIIKKIMEDNNISYNEFLLEFGKVYHARADVRYYDKYVEKFKKVCKTKNRTLKDDELVNNKYGLPNGKFFVDYCPDKNVKTYIDFCLWCGLEYKTRKIDKEFVDNALIELQNKNGKDYIITKNDITTDKIGFSEIVVFRLYGNLGNAKKRLGLNCGKKKSKPKNFEEYKEKLDYALSIHDSKFIDWKYLESVNIPFSDRNISHKSMIKSFKDNNMDFYAYIKSKGFVMNQSKYSSTYIFDDGELVKSNYEYLFSKYLKECGLIYNKDYKRDIMYKTIDNTIKRKINCDYLINDTYIEIGGVLNPQTDNWKNEYYDIDRKLKYKEELINKEDILVRNNCKYIILFPYDFKEDMKFKDKIKHIIERAVI